MGASSFQGLLPFAFQRHSLEGRTGVKGSLRRAKTRALDTGPTFQQDPPGKKAKKSNSELTIAAVFHCRPNSNTDPGGISLLLAEIGLDNGVHFPPAIDAAIPAPN